jgi:glycosyltransferase involved in cell wall biosynthesis
VKLSIITPTLNPGPVLERTIESVLSQGFDNLEHLIIDGGSSDGTLDLVHRFGHLKVVSEPDEGIFDAMNKGIAAASGDWIYFLGSDDYFADDHVLRELCPIFKSELDVVYGDIFDFQTGKRYGGPIDEIKIRQKNISHQAIFFKRRVFEQVGLFDKTYRSYADWDHNMRWMLSHNICKKHLDRVITVYAGNGFSFHNPDLLFQRDRLYRYLSYGKHELPTWMFWALWGKELGLGVRHMDWARIKRALSIPLSS